MLSCDLSLITMHISACCQFSDIHISQGSVATYLRCGGIFKYEFVANLPFSLLAKEFWKSVNILGSYGQEFSVLFFETQCIWFLRTQNISKSKFSGALSEPRWGSLQRSHRPSSWWGGGGLAAPSPVTSPSALGPLGLAFWVSVCSWLQIWQPYRYIEYQLC